LWSFQNSFYISAAAKETKARITPTGEGTKVRKSIPSTYLAEFASCLFSLARVKATTQREEEGECGERGKL